jgi:hypothetical protein
MRPNAGHHHAEHRSDHVMLLCLVIDKGLLFISVATATREVRVDLVGGGSRKGNGRTPNLDRAAQKTTANYVIKLVGLGVPE